MRHLLLWLKLSKVMTKNLEHVVLRLGFANLISPSCASSVSFSNGWLPESMGAGQFKLSFMNISCDFLVDDIRVESQRDGKAPAHFGFKWFVGSDVECVAWDPHDQYLFVVSGIT
ncbi:hypothetical protein Tco_0576463 [Tanacetum coccineum]